MAYLGNNSPSSQTVVPATDFFSGNGVTTAFTLSRSVISTFTIEAVINNVQQNPSTAYTVSGNVITFTSAPPAGTNNIYVKYNSIVGQQIGVAQGTIGTQQLAAITNIFSGVSNFTLQTGGNNTTALTVDTSGTVRAHGTILAGEAGSTTGTTLMQGYYSNGAITNFGTEMSSGGPFIGYGVSPGHSAPDTFLSSGPLALSRSALVMSGDTFKFWSGGSQTLPIGTAATLTEKMRITSAGYVLKPFQPAFYAYGGAAVASGTDFIVQFPSTEYNNGGFYSTSTYRFTAPVTGAYFFTFSGMANSADHNRFGLRKNGALYGGQKFAAALVYERFSASWVVYMAVGDYADIIDGLQSNGAIHNDYREFTGFLIG